MTKGKYIVIKWKSDNFEEEISKKIEEGYEPVWGIFLKTWECFSDDFYQAMILKD